MNLLGIYTWAVRGPSEDAYYWTWFLLGIVQSYGFVKRFYTMLSGIYQIRQNNAKIRAIKSLKVINGHRSYTTSC